jgi:hypothetical protein
MSFGNCITLLRRSLGIAEIWVALPFSTVVILVHWSWFDAIAVVAQQRQKASKAAKRRIRESSLVAGQNSEEARWKQYRSPL